MEAFTLGVLTAFFDNVIVLQALFVSHHSWLFGLILIICSLITLGVFLGLTLFTLQSKVGVSSLISTFASDNHLQYDFSGLGSWLFGGLVALCTSSFDKHAYVHLTCILQ